jgi:hypothetical protein
LLRSWHQSRYRQHLSVHRSEPWARPEGYRVANAVIGAHLTTKVDVLKMHGGNVPQQFWLDAPCAGMLPRVQDLLNALRHPGHHHIPTVCPSNNSANVLLYQELPTSIQLWRGHGQEVKRGEAARHRITRNLKCLGHFSSRVRPPGCPCSLCGARSVQLLEGSRRRPPGHYRRGATG